MSNANTMLKILDDLVVLKELGQFEGQLRRNFPEKFQIFGITPVKLYQFCNKRAEMIGNAQ